MKNKLESELMSIAHRILKLKGKEDVFKMHAEASALYEKLSVLKFAHENFDGAMPTIGGDSSFFGMLDSAFNNKISDTIEVEDKIYINIDDVEHDNIMERGIETIKDMVAQMPQETEQVEALLEDINNEKSTKKEHLEDITAGFNEMPVFEPISKVDSNNEKKTINDQIKEGRLNIGLNDKIAFVKHLFDGKNEDYDRVVSQLNTTESFDSAKHLIDNIIKPDYNNWEDKEELEDRFMSIIEDKFI